MENLYPPCTHQTALPTSLSSPNTDGPGVKLFVAVAVAPILSAALDALRPAPSDGRKEGRKGRKGRKEGTARLHSSNRAKDRSFGLRRSLSLRAWISITIIEKRAT